MVRTEEFDLIFSDVVMPGKDGLAFLEEFKALGMSTPVVMISWQAHIAMAVRATRLGAIDFLEKPISSDKLILTVQNALRLKRLEEENRQLRQKRGKHEMGFARQSRKRVPPQIEARARDETRV